MSKPAIKRDQQTELLHALNTAAASLQRSAHSEEDVFRIFREQVVALGMRGGISLLDASRKRLTMRVIAYPEQILSFLAELEKLTGLKADGFEFAVADADAYQQAVETGQAVFVPNNNVVVAQLLPQAIRPFAGRIQEVFGGAPSISAPLTTHGQVTGLLIVVGAGLTRDDVPAVQAFANHLAVALDNARAVSALQESEARYRVLFEQSPGGILLIDVETGKTIEANESAYKQLGYTREEFDALRISDYEALEKPEETARHMQKIMREGSDDFETLHRTKSGEIRNVHVWAKTLSLGERVLFYAIFQDITEHKQAEEALRESESLLRESQIIAGLGSYVLDFSTGLWKSSDILDKIFGIDETYVRSIEGWAELIRPDERQQMTSYFTNEVIGKHVRFDKEYRIVRKNDQAERWVYGVGELEVDAQDQLLKMHGIITDITERKQAEAALEENQHRLKALFDNTQEAILLADDEARYVDANPAACALLGYSREELLRMTVWDVTPLPNRELGQELWHTFIAAGQQDGEYTLHRKDGTTVAADYRAVANIVPSLHLSVIRDITERKQAEEVLQRYAAELEQRVAERTADLNRANIELERVVRVKDEFLANMSHELRTPLNSILGLSESLEEQIVGQLNEKQRNYVRTIRESGHHLLTLINDILDLAKIEAGQITLDINIVDIRSLCESSLRMVKELAHKKRQDIGLEIDDGLGLIWADNRRLKQMIVNLLSNAVKFTPEDGKIGLEVHGYQDENRVTITVWDNGIGIKESDLAFLFQPFVQLDSSLAREGTGTGLGLALVAQMARLHGGSVSAASEPGKGSRFTISLPWEPALATDNMSRMKITGKFRAVKPGDSRRTILLVEDTNEVIRVIRDYLEYAGYKVETAKNGNDGIAQAKKVRPDLILMDVQMPGMDGLEAAQRLRSEAEFEYTPIIALTALAMQGDRERCLAAGMDEYISKPVNLKAMMKMIQNFLSDNEESKPG